MDNIINDIDKYMIYLRHHAGLYVTLHPVAAEQLISQSMLIKYNLHNHPYCLYIKSNKDIWRKCISSQSKVVQKCREGEFAGTCHAGVYEFVYPITFKAKIMGFISVSGYRADEPRVKKCIASLSEEFAVPYSQAIEIYNKKITSVVPVKSEVDTLIRPLLAMLRIGYAEHEAFMTESGPFSDNALYRKILSYIHTNYNQRITVSVIAKALHCSKSSVSHLFKKNNGKSISRYLTELRMEEAKIMLECSSMNISEIASALDFSDSNYFSAVFKRHFGISPLKWKKSHNA